MYILGLCGEFAHDASACIVKDGKLLAYSEEERHTRKRHAVLQLPTNSIACCLHQCKITMQDIDYIAVSSKLDYGRIKKILDETVLNIKRLPPLIRIGHHLSHAVSAYKLSGFSEATILVIDGQGDDCSTSIYHAKGDELQQLIQYPISQSLGYFYSSITEYLQLGIGGEGKLMGLAAYGNPVFDLPIHITEDGYKIDNHIPNMPDPYDEYKLTLRWWLTKLLSMFGEGPKATLRYDPLYGINSEVTLTQIHKDIAASAQHILEMAINSLVNKAVKETHCRNIVLSGGVALNCSANGQLERSGLVDRLFVFPGVSDAGTCIGAAYEACKQLEIPVKNEILSTPYWEQSFSNDEIKYYLDRNSIPYQYVKDITSVAASCLVQNKIIGWFQGGGEMGPRALGNRSIIANPMYHENLRRINKTIKFRENWRPLAPSVLHHKMDWLFQSYSYSPYMLKAFYIKEEIKTIVPAIVHVDGTARPQSITKENNPLFFNLINHFYRLTDIPLVLNTSLNTKGEPICNTPAHAIQTFYSCDLDILILGNFILKKENDKRGYKNEC